MTPPHTGSADVPLSTHSFYQQEQLLKVLGMICPSTASTWFPLASESQRTSILPILDELEFTLGATLREESPNLSGGMAGRALFLGYLSKLVGREALKGRAFDLLGQAVERVNRTTGVQFYAGYTGIAWAVEHMQRQVFESVEVRVAEDANEDVDEMLLDLLTSSPWRDDYDLISGLVGYGVYALERLSKPRARQILSRVLDHLESLAVPQATGLGWPTAPELLPPWQRELAPKGYLNLGLAHGVPGVLILLAAMEKAGRYFSEIDSRRANELLESGMMWLFSQFQAPKNGSYLANWHPVGQEIPAAKPHDGRVAWCYGDLGVSLAILNSARLVGRIDWETIALEMARRAAAQPLETSGVRDISLCHGSAGNMLISQRLLQLTGENCFRQAGQMYLEHLINARSPGGPFAGYTAYKPDSDAKGNLKVDLNPYKPDSGLLGGAAGAGMALLSALGIEPKWDRFMLLSLPIAF